MKPYATRRLSLREQNQAQYISVTHADVEVCRTYTVNKAERLAHALALLDLVESGRAKVEAVPDAAD